VSVVRRETETLISTMFDFGFFKNN